MTKRVALATLGTQGDVQPYLALAVALKEHGYSVVYGTTSDFKDMIEGRGIEFYSIGEPIQEFLKQQSFDKMMSGSGLLKAPALLKQGQDIVNTAGRATWKMSQGADIILLNMNVSFCIDIAERLDIPAVMLAPQPLNMTKEMPFSGYDGPDFGPTFNRLTHAVTTVQQAYYDWPRNRLRRELMGLDRRRHISVFKDGQGRQLTTLYAFSEIVAPRPRDWPKEAIVTGYWQLKDNTGWKPDADFQAFLDAGPKPVYIGFGSMPFGAERNSKILNQAMKIWGGRAVVGRGWGGIRAENLPDSVYPIAFAPHDKLFQYVSAVVHHGGAGTTAAGLHAGRPTFVVPQAVDQPFWGRRVRELGCGPAPVRLRRLTAEKLAEALADLTSNQTYARNAADIASKLAKEDGLGNAVRVIDQVLETYSPHHVYDPTEASVYSSWPF